ncbi:MAG TPA: hypothetical protein GXZ59_06605, partial [Clostridiaceae bacterium]|nr:hypothetical protein [Clostridiaceae bacterium]
MNKISSYRPHWSNRIKHHHIKWSALLVLSALIITSLTPLLKTTFTPKLANAATPTITRLSQTIGLPAGGDKVTIYGSGFELAEFNQISAGDSHTCALGSNNQAYCWGYNYDGQLGNGNTTQQTTPVAVSQGEIPAGVHLTQISTGSKHTCA